MIVKGVFVIFCVPKIQKMFKMTKMGAVNFK